jgi:hypothetical protein
MKQLELLRLRCSPPAAQLVAQPGRVACSGYAASGFCTASSRQRLGGIAQLIHAGIAQLIILIAAMLPIRT